MAQKKKKQARPASLSILLGLNIILWLCISFFGGPYITQHAPANIPVDTMQPVLFANMDVGIATIYVIYVALAIISVGLIATGYYVGKKHSRRYVQTLTLETIILASFYVGYLAVYATFILAIMALGMGIDTVASMILFIILLITFYNRDRLSPVARLYVHRVSIAIFLAYMVIRASFIAAVYILAQPEMQ